MLQIKLVVNCLANMIGNTEGSMQLACLKPSWVRGLETEVHVNFSELTYPFTVWLSVCGERGEHLVLVNCLIKPDLGIKSKLPDCFSTKYKSIIKIKIRFFFIKLNFQLFLK